MDIVLAIIWVLAMVSYSFSSDYALAFPAYKPQALPFVRWGALLVAIALSTYLAIAYQEQLQSTGIWVFFVVVFVIILLSKLAFRWLIRRPRS